MIDVREEKFDLLKIDLALGAGVLTAVNLGVDIYNPSFWVGSATLMSTIFLQFLSLMSVFEHEELDLPLRKGVWDSNIILSFGSFAFFVSAFATQWNSGIALGIVPKYIKGIVYPNMVILFMSTIRLAISYRRQDCWEKAFCIPILSSNFLIVFFTILSFLTIFV